MRKQITVKLPGSIVSELKKMAKGNCTQTQIIERALADEIDKYDKFVRCAFYDVPESEQIKLIDKAKLLFNMARNSPDAFTIDDAYQHIEKDIDSLIS